MSDENKVLLRVSNLKQYFPIGKKKMGKPQSFVKANDGISLNIYEGETFGLVGESGCGKSTFGRTLLQLYRQTGGRTVYYGRTVEDFDLKYVEEIFKNLPDKKKKLRNPLLSNNLICFFSLPQFINEFLSFAITDCSSLVSS